MAMPCYFVFFLNICSMRCVTMNPPKMLTEANITAIRPIAEEKPRPAEAMSAPTTITLEIALVTLISGEWSAGVTRQTT